jgi:eukaryotic-like serine/threonine-protein kinase
VSADFPGIPPGYDVKRRIAEGGMGVVYQAVQTALSRTVAIKVLHHHLVAQPDVLSRFQREAQVLATLEYPHAVRVFDFVPGPPPALVMEFIDGESLDSVLERDKRLNLTAVADIADQVLSVLEAAHARGIVHRDLKPANLMLDHSQPAPFVRVVDFGIAQLKRKRTDTRLTKTGFVLGTVAYMSPEQASGETVDNRSDLYALACVLFELLTGRPPFVSGSPAHVVSAHLFREPPTLEECGITDVPPNFQRALRKALQKNAASRFASAFEFRQALSAGLVPSPRGERERQDPTPKPTFIAAEVDDASVELQLAGASPEVKDMVLTALAAVGVSVSQNAAPSPVVVLWPAPETDPLPQVDALARPGRLLLLCGPEDDLALMTRAIEHGVHDYIALPLDGPDLAKRVVRALKSSRTTPP